MSSVYLAGAYFADEDGLFLLTAATMQAGANVRGGTVDSAMVETLEKDQELVRAALAEADAQGGAVSAYWSSTRS